MPKSTVHLYPVPGVFLHLWPAVEFDATPEQWEELQGYSPPPFTDKRPPGTRPAPQPTEAPQGASSDSTEA